MVRVVLVDPGHGVTLRDRGRGWAEAAAVDVDPLRRCARLPGECKGRDRCECEEELAHRNLPLCLDLAVPGTLSHTTAQPKRSSALFYSQRSCPYREHTAERSFPVAPDASAERSRSGCVRMDGP